MVGTRAVILVGEVEVIFAEVVPSLTAVTQAKFDPVIVTCWPARPESGGVYVRPESGLAAWRRASSI
jgi:hypothetical protein